MAWMLVNEIDRKFGTPVNTDAITHVQSDDFGRSYLFLVSGKTLVVTDDREEIIQILLTAEERKKKAEPK